MLRSAIHPIMTTDETNDDEKEKERFILCGCTGKRNKLKVPFVSNSIIGRWSKIYPNREKKLLQGPIGMPYKEVLVRMWSLGSPA